VVPSLSASGKLVRLINIIDGTSNTLLVAEKWLDRNAVNGTGPSCNDDQGYVDGWDNDVICFAYGQNGSGGPVVLPSHFDVTGADNCGLTFGSRHFNLMAVFCDGSVHSINYSITAGAWVSLCSINDGVPLNMTDIN
jgi:hypothetical protein